MTYSEVRLMPTVFDRYPPALRVVCPKCGARPAQPCQSRRRRMTTPHPERVERAAPTRSTRRHPFVP